jgi:hypothetical protein
VRPLRAAFAGLSDPGRRTTIVLVALCLAGVVALFLAWRGAAATLGVWNQVPFVLSGAFGGVALLGAGGGLLAIHARRREAAEERAYLDELILLAERMLH